MSIRRAPSVAVAAWLVVACVPAFDRETSCNADAELADICELGVCVPRGSVARRDAGPGREDAGPRPRVDAGTPPLVDAGFDAGPPPAAVELWLYFGGASAPASTESVWSGFVSVYHLNDSLLTDPAVAANAALPGQNDATEFGVVTEENEGPGRIGGGVSLTGSGTWRPSGAPTSASTTARR